MYNQVFGEKDARKEHDDFEKGNVNHIKRERSIDYESTEDDCSDSDEHFEEGREEEWNTDVEKSFVDDTDEEWSVGTKSSRDDDSFEYHKFLKKERTDKSDNARPHKKACTEASKIRNSNENASNLSVVSHSSIGTAPTSLIKFVDMHETAKQSNRSTTLSETCIHEKRHESRYQQHEPKSLVHDLSLPSLLHTNGVPNKASRGTIANRIKSLAFQLNLNLNTSLTIRQQLECVEKAAEGEISEGPVIHRIASLEKDYLG